MAAASCSSENRLRIIGHRPPLKVFQNAHPSLAGYRVVPHVEQTTHVSVLSTKAEVRHVRCGSSISNSWRSDVSHEVLETWVGVEIDPAAGSQFALDNDRVRFVIQFRL